MQNFLEYGKKENWILTEAMKEDPEIEEKYKTAKIDTKLKQENDNISDDKVEVIKSLCEDWGHIWPKHFNSQNVTPKLHWLVFVVPKFISHVI